jgi:hypothetical protein
MIAFGRSTFIGIFCADVDAVLIVVVVMGRVQVPIVDVVRMIVVSDGRVSACFAMLMTMIAVYVVTHGTPPACLSGGDRRHFPELTLALLSQLTWE